MKPRLSDQVGFLLYDADMLHPTYRKNKKGIHSEPLLLYINIKLALFSDRFEAFPVSRV